MRYEPDPKFRELPCSMVGTGCAYEYLKGDFQNPTWSNTMLRRLVLKYYKDNIYILIQ